MCGTAATRWSCSFFWLLPSCHPTQWPLLIARWGAGGLRPGALPATGREPRGRAGGSAPLCGMIRRMHRVARAGRRRGGAAFPRPGACVSVGCAAVGGRRCTATGRLAWRGVRCHRAGEGGRRTWSRLFVAARWRRAPWCDPASHRPFSLARSCFGSVPGATRLPSVHRRGRHFLCVVLVSALLGPVAASPNPRQRLCLSRDPLLGRLPVIAAVIVVPAVCGASLVPSPPSLPLATQ